MNVEILNDCRAFRLLGLQGPVHNHRYGEVGLRLMNEMWQTVRRDGIASTGINHWVYLADGDMFVGVEPRSADQAAPSNLKCLEFKLPRYARHLHVGPYQALPQTWAQLKALLAAQSEKVGPVSLEIYGHHCEDPAQQETTILIGLGAPGA